MITFFFEFRNLWTWDYRTCLYIYVCRCYITSLKLGFTKRTYFSIIFSPFSQLGYHSTWWRHLNFIGTTINLFIKIYLSLCLSVCILGRGVFTLNLLIALMLRKTNSSRDSTTTRGNQYSDNQVSNLCFSSVYVITFTIISN